MESAQTRQGGQGAQADNDSILMVKNMGFKINVLSDISWGSNDKTTILTDQTFILVKIQTQEEAPCTKRRTPFSTKMSVIIGNIFLFLKPLRQQQSQSSSVNRGQAIINKLASLTDSSFFSRSGTATQLIIVGWSSSEIQTGNSSITLQK